MVGKTLLHRELSCGMRSCGIFFNILIRMSNCCVAIRTMYNLNYPFCVLCLLRWGVWKISPWIAAADQFEIFNKQDMGFRKYLRFLQYY